MLARTVEDTNDPCKSDRSSIKNIILDGGENDQKVKEFDKADDMVGGD